MKRIITFIAILFIYNTEIFAQWSLHDCIKHALEHNISLKQQENRVVQSELELSTARNARLPDLNVGASEQFSFGRGLTADNTYTNRSTTSTSFSINTSIPILTGMRIPNEIKRAENNLQALTADLEKARNDISLRVAQYYVQVVYCSSLYDIACQQVVVDSMQLCRLEEMYQSGKVSKVDVAQQKAAFAQSNYTAVLAKNDLQTARLNLIQLLEMSRDTTFDIVLPDTEEIGNVYSVPSPDVVYNTAVISMPEVLAEHNRLKASEYDEKIARSAYLPRLTLNGGIGTNYYSTSGIPTEAFAKQIRNNFSQVVGISLSIPIFNRMQTRNSIRQAQVLRENQQLAVDNVKKTLYKEIETACQHAAAALLKVRSCRATADSYQHAFELVKEKYENGKASITEYNEAKHNMTKAKAEYSNAKCELMYMKYVTDFYTGERLTPNS